MLLMGQSVQEIMIEDNTVIYLLLHLRFVINQKKSVLSLVPNIEPSGGFRDYDIETDRGKSSNSLNLLQNNLLQPGDIHFTVLGHLPSTIQAVLPVQLQFRYLQQQHTLAEKRKMSYNKKINLDKMSRTELK